MYTILIDLVRKKRELEARDVSGACALKNNFKCWPLNGSIYNATCCSKNDPCGILQGGCSSDDDCFMNLECSVGNCGTKDSNMSCCQPPGRKPGLMCDINGPVCSMYIFAIYLHLCSF